MIELGRISTHKEGRTKDSKSSNPREQIKHPPIENINQSGRLGLTNEEGDKVSNLEEDGERHINETTGVEVGFLGIGPPTKP